MAAVAEDLPASSECDGMQHNRCMPRVVPRACAWCRRPVCYCYAGLSSNFKIRQ